MCVLAQPVAVHAHTAIAANIVHAPLITVNVTVISVTVFNDYARWTDKVLGKSGQVVPRQASQHKTTIFVCFDEFNCHKQAMKERAS